MPALRNVLPKVPVAGLLWGGWGMFLLSIFLPVNVSIGGLTDPGQPHHGLVNLFYSLISFVILLEALTGLPKHVSVIDALDLFCLMGLGVCNLLILVSPLTLSLTGRKAIWARNMMFVAALYVCTMGFVFFRNFSLLYGHYVWCFSFTVVAAARRGSTTPGSRIVIAAGSSTGVAYQDEPGPVVGQLVSLRAAQAQGRAL